MNIKTSTLILLTAISALLITACTTTPYTRYKSPKISGHISINGKAAGNIPIYLSADSKDKNCFKVKTKTQTSSDGHFVLASLKEQMNYTPLLTYYLDEWNVCAEIDGKRLLIYSDNRYATGSVTSSAHIECRFDDALFAVKACRKTNP